jgi:hypothetical protein
VSAYRRSVVLALLAMFVGCRSDRRGARDCPIDPAGMTPEVAAIQCAEAFIARNGYTQVEPTTTLELIASESVEDDTALSALLEHRHNQLGPSAIVVCPGRVIRRTEPGWTVAFGVTKEYLPDSMAQRMGIRDLERAVTMDTTFGELRMEHMPFDRALHTQNGNCRELSHRNGAP